jgi:hypothetical protein
MWSEKRRCWARQNSRCDILYQGGNGRTAWPRWKYSSASWRQARISGVRENLRELIEQTAAYSGAADEELMS